MMSVAKVKPRLRKVGYDWECSSPNPFPTLGGQWITVYEKTPARAYKKWTMSYLIKASVHNGHALVTIRSCSG